MSESPGQARSRRFRPDLRGSLAASAAAIGVLILVGWALDLAILKSVVPGLIAMKPNAALGFVLAGSAIAAIPREGRAPRASTGLAGAATAIGAATLLEYFLGIDLGIDQVLWREPPGSVGSLAPGRMHPMTAFDFVLIGVATLCLAGDRWHRVAHSLALVAALVAGSALTGYLYGVRVFVGLATLNQMAVPTAVGMLAMASAVLLTRPALGLTGAIVGDTVGGLMARRLLPVAILAPIILNGLILLAVQAGLFDDRFGTAVRVMLIIAILGGVIGRNAGVLHRLDLGGRRADQALRALADAVPQLVWACQPDGRLDYVNHRWTDYTGQSPEQAVDRGWESVLHPDDLGRCLDRWSRSVRTGEPYEIEYRFRRDSDGSYRWFLGRGEPMRDKGGRVVRWFGACTDIHDGKLAGERRYRSLVEATSAIVWNTPASGEFESEQPGWSAFTGLGFAQIKGAGWLDAIHPDDRDETARAWSEAVAARSLYQVEHRLRRHDGEYRHMLVRSVPIFDPAGAVREWIGVHSDIDDRKRAHAALVEAKEAAEAATRAKGEFLANMSHEIRTPMNGILGMIELTLHTELSPRQREYLGLVKSSADALLTVIDDILDFSKIEAGKLGIVAVPFDLHDAVTDTLRPLALRAHDKNLELACRVAPDLPRVVVGDAGRVRQVLINLVGNAIKFTGSGEVVVAVEAGPAEGPDVVLRFSVADTGIGIPAAKKAMVFAAFEQVDNSPTRKYGGTGLGLAISTRLVELMGGVIEVEDNPGGGSIFRFTVRVRRPRPTPDPSTPDPLVLDGLRVLIVDDNRTNRLILEEVMSQWGCRPVAVAGASEALAALGLAAAHGEPFAVALIDRMMPEIDGLDLAGRVHADPRFAGLAMLLLSSGGPDETCRHADLGIGGRLNKPVRQSELLGALLDLLAPDSDPDPPPPPEPSAPTGPRLRVLLAEDHPVNQKVATRMLQDQGHAVTLVVDGRAAVDAVASTPFDVVLMDIQMPEMDGFEALAAIRGREARPGPRLPILALTAHAMSGDRERCLDAGFDHYLSKPIHPAALREALARFAPGLDPAPAAGPALAFDRRAALDGLGGDDQLLDEILGLFLADAPRLLAEARGAVAAADLAALGRLTHTVAGVAGNFAAPALVAAARRLEALAKAGDLAHADDALAALDEAFHHFTATATA